MSKDLFVKKGLFLAILFSLTVAPFIVACNNGNSDKSSDDSGTVINEDNALQEADKVIKELDQL